MDAVMGKGLRRSFGAFEAVKKIDFAISPGECYGFLGPNGAGKSTTIRMIHGMLPRSGGELNVLGRDIDLDRPSIKAHIGVVSQENNLDRDLTVRQNLLTYARYFEIPPPEARRRAAELLAFVQLDAKADSPLSTLSGGMQRRLAIARALINNPSLLILDEPTTGLDPQARHLIWRRLNMLKRQKITIILTTHYMEEAEQLCDRVAIMNGGEILLEGKPRTLIGREIGEEVVEFHVEEGKMPAALISVRGICENYDVHGETIYLYSGECKKLAQEAMRLEHRMIVHRRATLEDLFLKLAGRTLNE